MNEYDGLERRSYRPHNPVGWHLKKEVNISMIVAILTVGLSGIAAYYDLKRDVALLQADNVALHATDDRASDVMRDTSIGFSSQLNRIDAKLDRLIERGNKL